MSRSGKLEIGNEIRRARFLAQAFLKRKRERGEERARQIVQVDQRDSP